MGLTGTYDEAPSLSRLNMDPHGQGAGDSWVWGSYCCQRENTTRRGGCNFDLTRSSPSYTHTYTYTHTHTHTHGTIRSRFLRLKQIMGECRLYLRFLSRATKNFPGDFLSFSFSPLSSSKGTQREDSAAIRIIIINWKWFYSLKSLSFSFSLSAVRLFSRSSADIIDISLFAGTSYLCSNSLFLFF